MSFRRGRESGIWATGPPMMKSTSAPTNRGYSSRLRARLAGGRRRCCPFDVAPFRLTGDPGLAHQHPHRAVPNADPAAQHQLGAYPPGSIGAADSTCTCRIRLVSRITPARGLARANRNCPLRDPEHPDSQLRRQALACHYRDRLTLGGTTSPSSSLARR